MKYTIVKHDDLVNMVKHVEELINKEGWVPIGGIAIGQETLVQQDPASGVMHISPPFHFYAQALLLPTPKLSPTHTNVQPKQFDPNQPLVKRP